MPALLTLAFALLALALVEVDRQLGLDQRGGRIWAFGGGAAGARGVLQAIAGSLITVTGTVFSITIVALQLASSQFTPRVLRTFTRDRAVQLVLGVFVGTFTYALLVLRAVRSEADDIDPFVPGVAVVGAIVLALVSVGHLIYFVHHIARSIQVSALLERVTRDGMRLMEDRYPSGIGEVVQDAGVLPVWHDTPPALVRADTEGHLQNVVTDALFELESGTADPTQQLVFRIEPVVGDFVLRGETLASIWPAAAATDAVVVAVRRSCALGPERTLEQDAELPVRQLADIAVKALSPGINDPTTATTCLDRLAQLLVLAAHNDPARTYRRDGGSLRLVLTAPSFDRLADTAFAQVRHYGAADPTVAVHLLQILRRLSTLVPRAHRACLVAHGERMLADVRQRITVAGDLAAVEASAGWLTTPIPEGGSDVL